MWNTPYQLLLHVTMELQKTGMTVRFSHLNYAGQASAETGRKSQGVGQLRQTGSTKSLNPQGFKGTFTYPVQGPSRALPDTTILSGFLGGVAFS